MMVKGVVGKIGQRTMFVMHKRKTYGFRWEAEEKEFLVPHLQTVVGEIVGDKFIVRGVKLSLYQKTMKRLGRNYDFK